MLPLSLDILLMVSKTTSPQKLSAYDCVTLYLIPFSSCSVLRLIIQSTVSGSTRQPKKFFFSEFLNYFLQCIVVR